MYCSIELAMGFDGGMMKETIRTKLDVKRRCVSRTWHLNSFRPGKDPQGGIPEHLLAGPDQYEDETSPGSNCTAEHDLPVLQKQISLLY